MIAEIGAVFDYIGQAVEIEIDDRTFHLRPVDHAVLNAPNALAAAIASSMGKSYAWGVAFMFADLQQAMELWVSIAGISGFDGE